jgi:hypothetical protein
VCEAIFIISYIRQPSSLFARARPLTIHRIKMARNQEKANLMMNRWTAMKQEMAKPSGSSSNRRPYLASECTNVLEAEKWRRQIVHEISRKVAEIQNGESI